MGLRWGLLLALAAAALVAGLTALDRVIDGEAFVATDFLLDLLEWGAVIGAGAAAAWGVVALRGLRADQSVMRRDLERAVAQGAGWRARHEAALGDLAGAIRRQFDAWGLTPAEADIAGLMLKGVSLGDIARLRRTSEITIRQQAQGVYRKSGLSERAELAAFFLESMFEGTGGADGALPSHSKSG